MALQNTFSSTSLRNIWLTRRSLIQAIGIGLTGLIVLILGIQQGTGSIEIYNKIQTEQKKLDQFNKKIQELELVKVSEEFSQAREVDEVLPSHKPILELLNNLNSVANKTEVSIIEFEVRPGEIATDSTQVKEVVGRPTTNREQAKSYDKIDLALKVEGELNNVQSFMDLIERVAPFTTINNLSLSRKTIAGGQLAKNTQAELSLSTYFYTQSISATISAPLPQITDRERNIFQTILDFTPSDLEQQTTIIGSDQTDLFGIPGLNVRDLEN